MCDRPAIQSIPLLQPLSAEPLLDRLQSSRFSLQYILYFLALELNAQVPLQSDGEKAEVLFKKGSALIANATEHVTSHDFSDQSDKVQKLVNLFKKYHKRLVELEQAETLMGLDMGIDVDRFAQEEDYRREIILALARCEAPTESFAVGPSRRQFVDYVCEKQAIIACALNEMFLSVSGSNRFCFCQRGCYCSVTLLGL